MAQEAVSRGYSLPCSLEEWSEFDFLGSAGRWVSPKKYRLIERFKFYHQVAWDRARAWQKPFQKIARWRCKKDFYALPVEKTISHRLNPPQQLS